MLVELSAGPNERVVSATGIAYQQLKVQTDARRIAITFAHIAECRTLPEQCSWPVYDDGDELLPCLLYQKPGSFFFGENCPPGNETFDSQLGWVSIDKLRCYIVHSESFDVYVLTHQAPQHTFHEPA